jgi:hypothetical protein
MTSKHVILTGLAILGGLGIFECVRETAAAEEEHRPELYADAYLHASMALVEKYPRHLTNAQMIGADSEGHVYGHDGTFAVEVVYQGRGASSAPVCPSSGPCTESVAKITEPCILRYVNGLWLVDHVAVIPEFESRELPGLESHSF